MINPVNGRPAPIWVADYVLMDYGTGAVMGVPCGDQRDFDFAKKYGLEIAPIICEKDDPLYERLKDERELVVTSVDWDHAMEAEGYLVQSGPFTGMKGGKHSEAVDAIIDWLGQQGLGRKDGAVPPARLAHQPPALLGQPHPDDPLRLLRRRAGAL